MRDDNVNTLPSGQAFNIDRPDFTLLATPEEFTAIRAKLTEKIISIEFQIDMFEAGAYAAEDRQLPRDWLPRANKALKYAKLWRDQCQSHQGAALERHRQAIQQRIERKFVDVARVELPKADFDRIMHLAREAIA